MRQRLWKEKGKFIIIYSYVRNSRVKSKWKFMDFGKNVESSKINTRRNNIIFRLFSECGRSLIIPFNFFKIIIRKIFFLEQSKISKAKFLLWWCLFTKYSLFFTWKIISNFLLYETLSILKRWIFCVHWLWLYWLTDIL